MSPLEVDGEYRGAHASHVHPHPKLGKLKPNDGVHRAVIKAALPLINWLIDDDDVIKIAFGKLVHAAGIKYTPRVQCSVAGKKVEALLVDKTAGQSIVITGKDAEAAQKIAERIETKWKHDVMHVGGLKLV